MLYKTARIQRLGQEAAHKVRQAVVIQRRGLALHIIYPGMAFKDYSAQEQAVQLLQRSLERGRLGHAYLFTGTELGLLETLARTLAKTLSCQHPVLSPSGARLDCCERCAVCQKIENDNFGDLHWVRPESKTRIIVIEQIRDLLQEINLKPAEADFKVAILVAADRMNVQAANAFLKTLEEPPARSILILLTTEPQRLLETILSRCLRLNFGGNLARRLSTAELEWLKAFSEMAMAGQKSLLGRYRLLDVLLRRLGELRESISAALEARSPLEKYPDAEKELREKWEDEMAAAVEAEYRRQRGDLLGVLQLWLRDVWLLASGVGVAPGSGVTPKDELAVLPELPATSALGRKLSAAQALANLEILEQLQRWLGTNVQEALALEVGLLKLNL